MTIILSLWLIAVTLSLFKISSRLEKIENLIKSKEIEINKVSPASALVKESVPVKKEEEVQVVPQTSVVQSVEQTDVFVRFGNWLKEEWMLKLGVGLLLMGFGWFVTYAFMNNWIGPMGRITIGIVAGVLFLALGTWRIKTYLHQGSIFTVLGSTVILISVFAARELYDFFTPATALLTMFLSVAYVGLVSVKYKNEVLAFASLILAGIAPLLTGSPTPNYVSLFAYLLVVLLGTVWITVLVGKRELNVAALLVLFFYSAPHFTKAIYYEKIELLLLFAFGFTIILFFTNIIEILKSKSGDAPDMIGAAVNGLFVLMWILTAAEEHWKGPIIIAWMHMFVISSFMIFRRTKRKESFFVYAGVGAAMLAAATAVEYKGAALTIAYTIESALVPLVVYFVLKNYKTAEKLVLLMIVPVLLSVNSIFSSAWRTGYLHREFFVLAVLSVVLMIVSYLFRRFSREQADKESRTLQNILLDTGTVYLYIILWLSLHSKLDADLATTICLIIYTIIGLVVHFYGVFNDRKGWRLYGAIVLGFVVIRLLLIDVWQMDIAKKVVTFFGVGILLVVTAFINKKKNI